MFKEDAADFEDNTKCCICNNFYVHGDVIVREWCCFSAKYTGCVNGGYNINLEHQKASDINLAPSCRFF